MRVNMRISTKGRYALRLMLDLGTNCSGDPIRLKDVARRQGISEKYLEQIISVLNKAGFVRNRGRVLSREQLLDKVWGLDFEGGDRAVDARIRSLRAALGGAGGQIKTVFKSGYRLEEV